MMMMSLFLLVVFVVWLRLAVLFANERQFLIQRHPSILVEGGASHRIGDDADAVLVVVVVNPNEVESFSPSWSSCRTVVAIVMMMMSFVLSGLLERHLESAAMRQYESLMMCIVHLQPGLVALWSCWCF